MSDFEQWRKERACRRHKKYTTLKIAARKRSAFHSRNRRAAYIWQCDVCGFYHLSKIKKGVAYDRNEIRVNKRGELLAGPRN